MDRAKAIPTHGFTLDTTPVQAESAAMDEPTLTGPYAQPAIYDILHTPGTAEEVDVLMRVADRFEAPGGVRRRWHEPA